ncbi:MAG: hypothetical protein LBG64_02340 [Pseudomonadales bacterium]|jgi:uncharacterized protein YxeA|nr:hypothetical protein [Pseudomonadales bacterium]
MAKINLKTISGKVILGAIIWLVIVLILAIVFLVRHIQYSRVVDYVAQQQWVQRQWEEQSIQLLRDINETQRLGREMILPQVDDQLRLF